MNECSVRCLKQTYSSLNTPAMALVFFAFLSLMVSMGTASAQGTTAMPGIGANDTVSAVIPHTTVALIIDGNFTAHLCTTCETIKLEQKEKWVAPGKKLRADRVMCLPEQLDVGVASGSGDH